MKIKKALNNNVVLLIDNEGIEKIAFGTGIGFQKKNGDLVEQHKIVKLFAPEKNTSINNFLDSIPTEIIEVTNEIINASKNLLSNKLNDSLLFSLADHLFMALKRNSEIEKLDHPLQWEIAHLYPKEYSIGSLALEIINNKMGVNLPDVEKSMIGLHFVNAQFDNTYMGDILDTTLLMQDIIKTIEFHFHIVFDKKAQSTEYYQRFLIHLRYFAIRSLKKVKSEEILEINDFLYEVMEKKYKKSFECALKIANLLIDKYDWSFNKDEIIYLMIHIERVINST